LNFLEMNNEFYKERFKLAGFSPKQMSSPEDLRKLPVLTKEQVRNNTEKMISTGYQPDKLLKFKTGGSTGKALEIFLTEECSELRNACARRHDLWSGWNVGEPVAAVWGNPEYPNTLRSKLKEWLISPIIYLDTMCVSEESIEKFSHEWDRIKPTLLFGHAHSIYIVPKGILSSSMMLIPHERSSIEDVLGVKVTDRYGCEEVSLIASECEMHDGLHMNIEHLFVEFIKDDGTPAQPGEYGKIIVTDLMNKAMPLIRYQVEDFGIPSTRKCSCGRGLLLMESVQGRLADFLLKKDGARVAGISLIENTLTKFAGLDQMQIIQNFYDDFTVNIVPGGAFNNEITENLESCLKNIFGQESTIKFCIIDNIKPQHGNKYRFTICNIK
jgi:phenylacetate-coenzyme A ligase PaaK-like adenylate-forming protein